MKLTDLRGAKGHSVYMGADAGPFRCDHCEYYPSAGRCNNRIIIGYAKDKKFGLSMSGTLAVVNPGGCSDEFQPK